MVTMTRFKAAPGTRTHFHPHVAAKRKIHVPEQLHRTPLPQGTTEDKRKNGPQNHLEDCQNNINYVHNLLFQV